MIELMKYGSSLSEIFHEKCAHNNAKISILEQFYIQDAIHQCLTRTI